MQVEDLRWKSHLNPAASADGSADSTTYIQISYGMHLLICFDTPAHAFNTVSYFISAIWRHLSNNINIVSVSLQGATIQSYKTDNPR